MGAQDDRQLTDPAGTGDAKPDETQYELEPADEDPRPETQQELPANINETWSRHFLEQSRADRNFSVAELLIATTIAAVTLGIVGFFQQSVAAALLGLLVFIGLGMMSTGTPRPRLFRLVLWMLFLLYIVVAATVIVQKEVMSISVELFGIPRQRAGVAQTTAEGERLGDVLADLAGRFPELAKTCFYHDRLREPFVANLGGDRFITDPETPLTDGETLLILSADAGG